MKTKQRVIVNEPLLLLGYDWERYGKSGVRERDERDRADSTRGIEAIIRVHEAANAPLTLFVLGRLAEVPGLREILQRVSQKYSREFLDIQQHTYSHLMIKTNALRGEGADLLDIRDDLSKATAAIQECTGIRVTGLGSAQSFYRGLQDEPERQRAVQACGIEFIRSDGRGPGDTRPAPSYDEEGLYRGPYFYAATPSLVEIPAHGYSDNYLKGYSKEKPSNEWNINWEIDQHLEFFCTAVEERSIYVPLNHEWSIARKDPGAEVIRALIDSANEMGVEVVTFLELNKRIRTGKYQISKRS